MVEWKEELQGEIGERAHNLDELEEFNVPNFFVITPEETEELFKDVKDKDRVLNSQIKGEVRNRIKEAYRDIGVSSEVRNAVGKAKSLVGGQRSNPRVSVRISDRDRGAYKHELNVGSSNLFEAIKEVVSSYYEKNEGHPAVIVQKMIEPDYTGAVITDYSQNGLVEIVEGLGTALEKGMETPHFYLIGKEGLVDKRINGEQKKVERNPINGEERRKSSGGLEIKDTEIKEFFGKAAKREINVKFAYKRGSFHVVDVWKAEKDPERKIDSLTGIKIGDGTVVGEVGREIKLSDQPIDPEKYKALITKKGGYTSRKVQKARKYGKNAVLSLSKDLEPGSKVEINDEEVLRVEGEEKSIREYDSGDENFSSVGENPGFDSVTGSRVLPINPSRGDGLYTSSVFHNRVKLVEGGEDCSLTEEEMVKTYKDAFSFDQELLVLDTRGMEHKDEVIDYLEAEKKVIVLKDPEVATVEKAVESGFETFAVSEERVEQFRNVVAKAEKRFMLEKLRDSC